jgi:hypothetical protein
MNEIQTFVRRTTYKKRAMDVIPTKGVTCRICDKYFEKISWHAFFRAHIGRFHQMRVADYVYQFIHPEFTWEKCGWCDQKAIPVCEIINEKPILKYDGRFVCNNEKCANERKKHNPRSYHYAVRTFKFTEKQARLFVKTGSPFHREFFKDEKDYNNFQNQTSLSSFIRKYGTEKGQVKYKEYVQHWKETCGSEESYIKRLGKDAGQKRHAEIRKSKAVTRQHLRLKYGEEEGDRRYESFLDKTLKNFVSSNSCLWLNFISFFTGFYIQHGKNSSEKKIRCPNRIAPVDGYCADLDVVFEFFGDKWHCNPRFYRGTDANIRRCLANDVWQHDHLRLCDLVMSVKAVIVCWEHDWNNNRKRVVENSIEYVNQIVAGMLPRGVYYV